MAKVDDFSRFLKKSDDKQGIIDEKGAKRAKMKALIQSVLGLGLR